MHCTDLFQSARTELCRCACLYVWLYVWSQSRGHTIQTLCARLSDGLDNRQKQSSLAAAAAPGCAPVAPVDLGAIWDKSWFCPCNRRQSPSPLKPPLLPGRAQIAPVQCVPGTELASFVLIPAHFASSPCSCPRLHSYYSMCASYPDNWLFSCRIVIRMNFLLTSLFRQSFRPVLENETLRFENTGYTFVWQYSISVWPVTRFFKESKSRFSFGSSLSIGLEDFNNFFCSTNQIQFLLAAVEKWKEINE